MAMRLRGIIELGALASFLLGVLSGNAVLVNVGGAILLVIDIGAVIAGVLSPIIPAILALVLALLVNPWHYGIYWSVVVFKVLDIPTNLQRLSGSRYQ